jgi:hypothetical protein
MMFTYLQIAAPFELDATSMFSAKWHGSFISLTPQSQTFAVQETIAEYLRRDEVVSQSEVVAMSTCTAGVPMRCLVKMKSLCFPSEHNCWSYSTSVAM